MTAWEEAVATALVGTERRPPPDAALEGLGMRPHATSAAEALLCQAVVLASRRAAGWVPSVGSPPPEPAAVDDRPPCSPKAVQVLDLLLQVDVDLPAGGEPVLDEWLTAAASAGRRVPSRLLPTLLKLGAARRELRQPVMAVVGPPGRWLAQRNPTWRDIFSSPDGGLFSAAEERFSTGSRPEREEALGDVRAADPGRAREMLMETWASESAADRAALLSRLAIGLSDEDEPFLEAALDDRAKSVRAVASDLLERLPSSRRSARMAARLEPLVRTRGALRPRVEVAYPDEPDKAARRDGVTDQAPSGFGTRAWWLFQLVAGAPLSFWPAHTGVSPAELIGRGVPVEIRLGWERAAERQGNAEWARLLLAPDRMQPGLLAALPAEEGFELVERALSRKGGPTGRLAMLLGAVPGPWPPGLSRAVIDWYRRADPLSVQLALPLLASRLDPSVADDVNPWLTAIRDDYVRRHIAPLHHALTLRRTISEEFT